MPVTKTRPAPAVRGSEAHTSGAIAIGSRNSSGWAANELCEQGLKTLVLERGRNLEHIADDPSATKESWELPIRYADTAPWYSYVEELVGISGNGDGLRQITDGEYLPPMELNCVDRP